MVWVRLNTTNVKGLETVDVFEWTPRFVFFAKPEV